MELADVLLQNAFGVGIQIANAGFVESDTNSTLTVSHDGWDETYRSNVENTILL